LTDKKRVLFVCVHNSARSQMAEAFLRQMAGDRFEVESAGFEPAPLNPLAVKVMAEAGLDISGQKAKSVFEKYRSGELFDYVISVCDEASAQRCPVFPGITARLSWSFPDPASFSGSEAEKMAQARQVRDQIRKAIEAWLSRAG